MAYVKVRPPVKIYHLTGKDNLNSILDAASTIRNAGSAKASIRCGHTWSRP